MCAFALLALVLPAAARAGSLQPDPPTTPAPVGLQPDTFASTPAAPAAKAAAPTPVTHLAPVTAGSVVPSLATRPVEKPPPAVLAPVETPLAPAATHVVDRHTQTKMHRAARHHAVPRLRLPARVGAVSTMRLGLLAPVRAAAAPAVPARRNLVPAALALLALVVTSGCFLTVAARHRQEGLGP